MSGSPSAASPSAPWWGSPATTTSTVKSWVQQTLAEHGVLFNGGMFICARHTDADIDRALDGFDAAFAGLAGGAEVAGRLRGPAVQPVFRTP